MDGGVSLSTVLETGEFDGERVFFHSNTVHVENVLWCVGQ